jgi:hypothetical protein
MGPGGAWIDDICASVAARSVRPGDLGASSATGCTLIAQESVSNAGESLLPTSEGSELRDDDRDLGIDRHSLGLQLGQLRCQGALVVRDQLRFHEFINVALRSLSDKLPAPGVMLREIENTFARQPPHFLSEAAREGLRHGLEFERRLAQTVRPALLASTKGLQKAMKVPRAVPKRDAQILASHVLLSFWSSALVAGKRPASDEVANSIAKNYENILGGLLVLTRVEPPPVEAD